MTTNLPSPTQIDEHVHCPWCRYDLFGLPDDHQIVRCPECGNEVNRATLLIPIDERTRQLRRMEMLPALCAAALCLAAWLGHLAVSELWAFREVGGGVEPVAFVLAIGLVLAWLVGATIYLYRYRRVPGAAGLLILLHVCAALLLGGSIMTLVGLLATSGPNTRQDRMLWLVVLTAGATALLVGGWLYRRARGILRNMHDRLLGRGGSHPDERTGKGSS